MAKAKLSAFKKFVQSLSEAEKEAEMYRLFKALPTVQEFYAQELGDEKALLAMLNKYKKKIEGEFWTSSGTPKIANGMRIRNTLKEFEKICVNKAHLIDLLLVHAEAILGQAAYYGGMRDMEMKAAISSFGKALKIIEEEQLQSYFKERCLELPFLASDLGYGIEEHFESMVDGIF